MKAPGITVKPIQTIDGGHEVNEVFSTTCAFRSRTLVGEENRGWDYAKFLLANERNGIARVGVSKARLDRVRQLAVDPGLRLGPKIEDPFFAAKLAEVEVELKALEMTQMRVISNRQGAASPIPLPRCSRSRVRRSSRRPPNSDGGRWTLRAALSRPGRHGQRARRVRTGGALRPIYFNNRKVSIYRRIERDPARHHRQGDMGL